MGKLFPEFLIIFLLMLITPFVANAASIPAPANLCSNPEFDSFQMNVNGLRRQYCIHIPSFPTNKLPVILAFHGGNQTPNNQIEIWGKHTEQGMVIVAPKALEREDISGLCKRMWRSIGGGIPTWPDYLGAPGPCQAAAVAGGPAPIDELNDLDFVKQLMHELNKRFNVSGFYAAGFSSGGGMVYQLYITKPFVKKFKGFAVVSNTIKKHKKYAVSTAGAVIPAGFPYTPNTNIARPFMYIMGTADKVNSPTESISDVASSCIYTPGAAPADIVLEGLKCWNSEITAGNSRHRMKTPREDTMGWLVRKNGSNPNPIISLYPNLGSFGRIPPDREVDTTAVIRQDFVADVDGAEPVAVITVLDGGHVWPGGKSGNQAPCFKNNCDIDASNEILQFWRANAGFPRP